MEYDKRITKPDMILNCFDVKFVMANYRNKNGYFTDCIDYYADLSKCHYGKLTDIRDDDHAYHLDSAKWYNFFLPESSIRPKKKEKEYKPFNSTAFEQCYGVGAMIVYRDKKEKHRIYKAMITSTIRDYMENTFYVVIRGFAYTLDELFEKYEICEFGEWKPFGVKE